jgi:hypothetical protein
MAVSLYRGTFPIPSIVLRDSMFISAGNVDDFGSKTSLFLLYELT